MLGTLSYTVRLPWFRVEIGNENKGPGLTLHMLSFYSVTKKEAKMSLKSSENKFENKLSPVTVKPCCLGQVQGISAVNS